MDSFSFPIADKGGVNIDAWAESTMVETFRNVHISSPPPNSVPAGSRGATTLRGTAIALDIPLDTTEQTFVLRPRAPQPGTDAVREGYVRKQREPMRRDSLKRREALLKGKEGSRRRQKWENGAFSL